MKVLITFLGTGQKKNPEDRKGAYKKAKYQIDSSVFTTSIFGSALQQAKNYDRIHVIGTLQSMWDECFYEFNSEKIEDGNSIVEQKYESFQGDILVAQSQGEFQNHLLKIFSDSKVQPVLVEAGSTESELQANLGTLSNLFNNMIEINDSFEIDIDITHSFRSLPFFFLSFASFYGSIFSKQLRFRNIYYAMFEKMDNKTNIIPIVNLNSFFEMLAWQNAAISFKNYLNVFPVLDLLKNQSKSQDAKNSNLYKQLEDFALSLELNQNKRLKESFYELAGSLTKKDFFGFFGSLFLPSSLKEILKELQSSKSPSHSDFLIAKRYFENKHYAKSIFLLQDAILTKIREKYPEVITKIPAIGGDPDSELKLVCDSINNILRGKYPNGRHRKRIPEINEILKSHFPKKIPPDIDMLAEVFQENRDFRNGIVHQESIETKKVNLPELIGKIGNQFQRLENLFLD